MTKRVGRSRNTCQPRMYDLLRPSCILAYGSLHWCRSAELFFSFVSAYTKYFFFQLIFIMEVSLLFYDVYTLILATFLNVVCCGINSLLRQHCLYLHAGILRWCDGPVIIISSSIWPVFIRGHFILVISQLLHVGGVLCVDCLGLKSSLWSTPDVYTCCFLERSPFSSGLHWYLSCST